MSKDIEQLTVLNRDYVASVQNSDVKRFDEILAEDFYCTNPDKSLVDRAGFLKQTAVPVTIKNLEAHDVKIRVLGDFCDHPCATSYTTPDGGRLRGATPTAGRGKTDAGSRYRRMCRGDKNCPVASSRRTPGPILRGFSTE
jgi:hypothetical protein